MADTCDSCKFSQPKSRYSVMCRRFPPGLYPEKKSGENYISFTAVFPSVDRDGWCGEYSAKEEG